MKPAGRASTRETSSVSRQWAKASRIKVFSRAIRLRSSGVGFTLRSSVIVMRWVAYSLSFTSNAWVDSFFGVFTLSLWVPRVALNGIPKTACQVPLASITIARRPR